MPLVDVAGRRVELDTVASDYNAGYLTCVDIAHHKVHEGYSFRLYDYDEEVDALTPKYWLAVSPASTKVHWRFKVNTSLPGLLQGFAGSTITDNGTLVSSANADFGSALTAEQLIYKDPTVSADGVQAFVEFIGTTGTNPVGAAGGGFSSDEEVIFPASSTLLIKFTSEENDTHVTFASNWYEVPTNG